MQSLSGLVRIWLTRVYTLRLNKSNQLGESSATIRASVDAARQIQRNVFYHNFPQQEVETGLIFGQQSAILQLQNFCTSRHTYKGEIWN